MARLDEYAPIVGPAIIDDLRLLSERLTGTIVQNVNSTAVGGGVAEILSRMVPLLRELGIDARWDVIKGGAQFFAVTKKLHNALHGRAEELTERDWAIFLETSAENARAVETYGDIVFVHDPQPIALVEKRAGNRWLWRCHIDVSNPSEPAWRFLEPYIDRFDAGIFSAPSFSRPLPIRQYLIAPSIDPLSDKNRDLLPEEVNAVFEKYGVPRDKPVVTQISRFDRLKDPLGVIAAYRLVKRSTDCRLVLAGGGASDDPEGVEVLNEVRERAAGDSDIHVLLMAQNDLDVNALQRGSDVIVQKSIREGFGLTVTEALWKGKPVVASNVGGIALQVSHKYSGLLCHSIEGAAFSIKQLLNAPDYARRLGENGREHVRNNFLLTRHLRDYLLAFLSLSHPGDVVYL